MAPILASLAAREFRTRDTRANFGITQSCGIIGAVMHELAMPLHRERLTVKRRTLIHFGFALLLLFAQQVALAHAAWHAFDPASEHRQEQGDASFQGELCSLHGVFGQLLGGVQSDAPELAVAPNVAADAAHAPVLRFVLFTELPRSRGPPPFS